MSNDRIQRRQGHISVAKVRDGIPPMGTYEKCPHCGGKLNIAFGLAGGGFGPYDFCDPCGKVIQKDSEIEDDNA